MLKQIEDRKALMPVRTAPMIARPQGVDANAGLLGSRAGGLWLAAAALLFWLAWCLMPGVGITDASDIFLKVGAHRGQVKLSVMLQLASAALYAPALLALALRAHAEQRRGLLAGAVCLLIGAAGSAADSVFHWLAAEMTAPGVPQAAMLPVMARMQGPALIAVAPLIAAFFLGTGMLAAAGARAGWVSRRCAALALSCPLLVPAGALLVPDQMHLVALAFLGCVAGAQAWVGLGLRARLPLA